MISVPNMIIIGASKTGAGKTTFACALIEKLKEIHPVAIKVTAIEDSNEACPSGKNCGVCTSFSESYIINEEKDISGSKDTNDLLRSGAARVFWLRTKKSCLESSAVKILSEIDPGACIVCESTSARKVIAPGVFIICSERPRSGFKQSAREVLEYADRIVSFDDFDKTLDCISFIEGRWSITESRL